MPSTSVHFPEPLLEELDRLATERGLSRNRLIVEACRDSLRARKAWPEGFFDEDRLSRRDLEELRSGAVEFEKTLFASRQTRRAPPF